jgi:hypothetical protein
MLLLAEVFGQSGDSLDLGLVITLLGGGFALGGWLLHRSREEDRTNADFNLRLTIVEREVGIDAKKSGVYSTREGK